MKLICSILLFLSLFKENNQDPTTPKVVNVGIENDSTYLIDINEYRIRILLPKGVIVSNPTKYSGSNYTLSLSPSIVYNDYHLAEIEFTKQQYVRNEEINFNKYIKGGGTLQGDSNPPETEEEFKYRKQLLIKRETGGFFNEFSTSHKRNYGHRRYRDGSCGCYVSESYTFINDIRIKVSITTNADSISRSVEQVLMIKMRNDFNYGEEYQATVLDSLHDKFLSIISKIQFKKY